MEYADNLYSADDSDNESMTDELSPADGYFSNHRHPRHVMVPDPSAERNGSDADTSKAHEARQEAESNLYNIQSPSHIYTPSLPNPGSHEPHPSSETSVHPAPHAPMSHTAWHVRSQGPYTESSHLLYEAPPPTYSAAPPQSSYLPSQAFDQNYRSISHQRLEEGNLSRQEPESMGGPTDSDEQTPLWRQQPQSPYLRRTYLQRMLLIALFISIALGLIVAVSGSKNTKNQNSKAPGKIAPPSAGPNRSHGPFCRSATTQATDVPTYQFNSGRDLAIIQTILDPHNGLKNLRTAGEIILRRLPDETKDNQNGLISFDIWFSRRGIDFKIDMDNDSQTLRVATPLYLSHFGSEQNCLSLEITIWLPYTANFTMVQVSTSQLAIRVLDDVDINVSEKMVAQTIAEAIHFPTAHGSDLLVSALTRFQGIVARELYVESISGQISGVFPLLDKLLVESVSGDLDVSVKPYPVLKSNPKPAELSLQTKSGQINVDSPINHPDKIPERDYITRIKTVSGNISGGQILGSMLQIESRSGQIDIVVFPDNPEQQTKFFTDSTSGNTRIKLLSPIGESKEPPKPIHVPDFIDIGPDDPYLQTGEHSIDFEPSASGSSLSTKTPLRHIDSKHSSIAGTIKALYPPEWEGKLLAVSLAGRVKVDGEGLELFDNRLQSWGEQVVARKGRDSDHASSMTANCVSSSIDIWVGSSCKNEDWCKFQ